MAEDSGGVSADRLRSFIDRLETLEEEKRGVSDQLKEVFGEAKSEGYDVKILRLILKLRRMKPHDRAEQDDLLETYRSAVGV